MPRRICFLNYKGGVGKTSLIVNVAACMTKLDKRVLIVDLDTQSNASIWLMRLDRWNVVNTRPDASVYSIFNPGTVRLKDLIHKDVVQDKNKTPLLPGLDIIPTTFNLTDLEQEYDELPEQPPYVIFQEQMAEIEEDYDYIMYDCPPNVLRASQLGLFSSNEVYVPSNPDALSLIGFTLLVDKLQRFHQRAASFRRSGMGKPAEIQGIIFNSVKTGVDIQVPKMRMQFRLNQFRNQNRVGRAAKIFAGEIRDAIVVRRAVTLGMPVISIGASREAENVVNDYMNVAKQIERQGALIG